MATDVDFRGLPLEIGDLVVSTDGGYANMVLFEVIGFTPKKVRIVRVDGKWQQGASHRPGGGHGPGPVLRSLTDIAKVSK